MFYLENKKYDAVGSSIYNIFVYATEFFQFATSLHVDGRVSFFNLQESRWSIRLQPELLVC